MSNVELISCGVCVLLIAGILKRHRPRVHIPIMACAFVADMSLVAYIEITRQAIETAKSHMTPLMAVHVGLSVAVIVLYLLQILTGVQKALGRRRAWHGKAGAALVLLRFGNLITSFMVTRTLHQ